MYRPFLTCLSLAIISVTGLSGCEKKPPAERPPITASAYTQGDAVLGQQQYDKACGNCHKLQAGKNEKAPQLLRIYGAQAGLLSDYQYTDALKNSHLTWTAENIDKYIADPKNTIVGTKMKSDPVTDPKVRQNIIAYLSTLN